MTRRTFATAAAVALFATTPAVAGDPEKADVLTTAARAGQFRTLINAVVAAGLDGTLRGADPVTVFAPTDDAFKRLPPGVLADLLKPANADKLAALLKYHVVPKGIQVTEHAPPHPLDKAATLAGPDIRFTRAGTTVKVNDATIVVRNIACTNGRIQVIDAVLTPPEADKKTIPAVAAKAGKFRTLLAALKAAELADVLAGDGPFTVLAPTDEAFAKLPAGTVDGLLKPENRHQLQAILKYHVVAGKVSARDAVAAGDAKTLQGGSVGFRIVNGQLKVNDARVTATDIDADNGVIHVIDAVLLPK